jgi:hypothetical protein
LAVTTCTDEGRTMLDEVTVPPPPEDGLLPPPPPQALRPTTDRINRQGSKTGRIVNSNEEGLTRTLEVSDARAAA